MKTVSINYLRQRIRNTHPRTRKAQLNTALGLAIKGGGMLISLLLVPVTIDYLSKNIYGTWLTISSVVTMLAFFDIGIGNGLRNKFSEAVAKQDASLARAYVSTAYVVFGVVQIIIFCFSLLLINYAPWQRIFNTDIDLSQLQVVILITVVSMTAKLLLDILIYVLYALQESSNVSLLNLLTNILILLGTYILKHFARSNLTYLVCVTALSPVIVILLSSLYLYSNRLQAYRPSLGFVQLKYAKGLLSLGYKFFIIQIAVVILFYSDNLIITQLFGPAEVTTYNVAFRYFNAINTLFMIIITPYWSAFTEASIKQDYAWMQHSYKYLQKLWVILLFLVLLMITIAEPAYKVWVGERITIPNTLNIVMGMSVLIIGWNNVTVSAINGLGKIRIQLFCSVAAALINIPLSLYLGREMEMGSAGVIMATCLSLLPSSIFGTIQAKKLINNTASGIWAD